MPSIRIRRRKLRDIPELKAGKVKVGFPAGMADSDVVNIAVWNHYGTRTIQERPFLENAIRANRSKYRQAMQVSAEKILRGSTSVAAVMSKLGILAQRHIQEEITALKDPANAASTIAKKGSSNPLIDTGRMRGSVTYEVEQ